MATTLLVSIMVTLFLFLSMLISIAFLTLVESKFMASTQNSKGPNSVGPVGMLQPFADAAKLMLKESIYPSNAKFVIFLMSPLVSFFFALISWAFIPFSYHSMLVDMNLGLFFMFTTSILHIYGVILAGWASGSSYSFLGALRSTAQLIAYDMSIGVIMCSIALFTNSLNLIDMVAFQDRYGYLAFYLPNVFALFLAASLAQNNEHPFDLPEAESELVGGYNTEYSSSYFAYFFLGEYCSILLMVFLMNHLFLGGWTTPFETPISSFLFYSFKLLFIYYFFLMMSAAMPRYRYDQLMRLGWKFMLPLSLSFFMFLAVMVLMQDNLYLSDILLNLPKNPDQYRKYFYDYFYGVLPMMLDVYPPKSPEDPSVYAQMSKVFIHAMMMPEWMPGTAKYSSLLLLNWYGHEGKHVDEHYYYKEALKTVKLNEEKLVEDEK